MIWTSHLVAPPVISSGGAKIEITPVGDGFWIDSRFDSISMVRQVNQILGNLCRLHYPGVLTMPTGERVLCQTWDQYRFAPDRRHRTAQGAVSHDFWLRFCLPEVGNHHNHALQVFNNNAHKVVKDAISYARIQANNAYYKEKLGQRMSKATGASSIYLTEEQYRSTRKSRSGPANSDVCHYCHKPGHWKRNFKEYLEEQKNKKGSGTSASGAE
ncbi:hypothetical protein GUJ93_ZPchr0009g767 [Zizania palustris]|uniref:Uncharacterized protein n=1 Tax=Zizania palustris TaxID=103762 RepID=A0A8J5RSX6_ZIZPA|nr:hypothetical protein GUJ93_ZPchr0009g767 [Zizania palustris]